METTDISKKERLLLLLFSLMAGILFNYLFYEKPLGISYPIFVFLLLLLFWWSARRKLVLKITFGWFLLIPIILLSLSFAIYSNQVLAAINFALIPVLLAAHSLLATNSVTNWSNTRFLGKLLERALPLTIKNFPQPFLFAAAEFKSTGEKSHQIAGKKIIIGLAISVPILLAVVPLLSSADMVFNHYLFRLMRIEDLDNLTSLFSQAIIGFLVFTYLFSYLWSFQFENPLGAAEKSGLKPLWDPIILLTVLFSVNIIYLIFSVIQFSYLYGGNIDLPAGFTYADYARRGFFELVAVALINFSILLGSLNFIKKNNPVLHKVVQICLSLLVFFSLNMLFSAHYKMSLYEAAYGLTYLRVFVHYFMGLLLVLFLAALTNIWWEKLPLIKTIIILTLTFYTILNFINVDKIIARYNVHMYLQTGRIDVYYLQRLSYDAVPYLVPFMKNKDHNISGQTWEYLSWMNRSELRNQPWQSANYSKYKAALTLKDSL